MQAQLIPDLAETRIDVEEDSPRGEAEDFFIPEITHDIQQEVRVSHPLEEPRPGHADEALAAPADQDVIVLQPEAPHDVADVAEIDRIFRWRVQPRLIDTEGRFKVVDEEHLAAEPLEAQEILEQHPGVARDLRLLGQRTSDHEGVGHRRSLTSQVL